MKILLDTHILIWYVQGNTKLQSSYRELITNSKNKKFVSIASLWEIAIKLKVEKIALHCPLASFVPKGIELLPILPKHIYQTIQLPLHHRDPFDRMIIAQAITENLVLMTDDSNFPLYDVNLI